MFDFLNNKNKEKDPQVKTRIAPSPTGPLHVGTARSALFNFLFAKKQEGLFFIRIEDTDTARSEQKFEKDIMDGLAWLNIHSDGFVRQSERGELYANYIDELIKSDRAYVSVEKSKQRPDDTVEVVRLRNSGKSVTFNDMIRGEITIDTTDLGDFVIARSKTEPLYHLAVVIDDAEMGITHIIRGEDHISNTPRHILIQEALGINQPYYAHLPLLLAPDRSKLSKRTGVSPSITELKNGYLPEAVVSYLALLGWNPGTEQEYFSMDELIAQFDISKVQKGGAIFDIEKLRAMNNMHLQNLSPDELLGCFIHYLPNSIKKLPEYNECTLQLLIPLVLQQIKTMSEITALAESGELDFYFKRPQIVPDMLMWKDETDKMKAKEHLGEVWKKIDNIDDSDFSEESVKKSVWDYATEHGRGFVLWPMRVALSGREKSPDPFVLSGIFGKTETLARIAVASDTI